MFYNKSQYQIIIVLFLALSIPAFSQEGSVTIDQDASITKLLEYKKDIQTVKLFKIQIYSGTRSGAEKSRKDFLNNFYQWPVSMEFDSPNTKIWVGNFRSRLEADKALLKIKKKYSSAFIFEPKKDKKK